MEKIKIKEILILLLCVPLIFSCEEKNEEKNIQEGEYNKEKSDNTETANSRIEVNPPSSTEIKRMENKSLVTYIYIRKDYITLNDSKIVSLNDSKYKYDSRDKKIKEHIQNFIMNQRKSIDESQIPKMITSIKADKDVPLGIITDVKSALREVDALKIRYQIKY